MRSRRESGKLERYFSNAFGPVTKVKSDAQKGIAWVTFMNESDAQKAVLAFPEEKQSKNTALATGDGDERKATGFGVVLVVAG